MMLSKATRRELLSELDGLSQEYREAPERVHQGLISLEQLGRLESRITALQAELDADDVRRGWVNG